MQYRDPLRPYSMTQIRAFYSPEGCDFIYYLQYVLGQKGTYPSTVWLGRIVHELLQQGYHDIPLQDAHQALWKRECDPILADLEAWYELDRDYYASGRPNTKARERWKEQHPEYEACGTRIEEFRDEFLRETEAGDLFSWAKSSSLAEYYRWSRLLLTLPPDQLFLPDAFLVEGQPLYDDDGQLNRARFGSTQTAERHYTLLSCTLEGLKLVGAPDYVACDADGVVWIADAKVMSSSSMRPEDIAEDGQLNLYVEMLRQRGSLARDQPVRIGHQYFTRGGMDKETGLPAPPGSYQVWATPSPHALPRLTKQLVRMDRRIRAGDFFPVRGIATGTMSPCPSCLMADACRTHWQSYAANFAL